MFWVIWFIAAVACIYLAGLLYVELKDNKGTTRSETVKFPNLSWTL